MSAGSRKKRQSVNQTVGSMIFGLEPALVRTPPAVEDLVVELPGDVAALPDAELLTLELPDAADLEDPWAGIEEELDDDDPWSDYAAEAVPEAAPERADAAAEDAPKA